jgi:hypothetical protein
VWGVGTTTHTHTERECVCVCERDSEREKEEHHQTAGDERESRVRVGVKHTREGREGWRRKAAPFEETCPLL